MSSSLEKSQQWISDQQSINDTSSYCCNQSAVNEQLRDQRLQQRLVDEYQTEQLTNVLKSITDQQDIDKLQAAYDQLKLTTDKRAECLQTAAHVDKLEDLFGPLTNEFSLKAVELVTECVNANSGKFQQQQPAGATSNGIQRGILAVRHNWSWISKLLKCADIHLQNSAEYHQFFYEVQENEAWLLDDMRNAAVLLNRANIKSKEHGYDASRMLFELKTALSMLLNWANKCNAMFERSRKLVPVGLRTKKLDYHVPVRALANYKTSEITILEDEELTLIDNSLTQTWQVKNDRAQTANVPSTILLIPGPDVQAIQAAIRLKLQLLAAWTNDIKRFGKTLIWFLLQVLREWTPEEVKMLHALSPADKTDLLLLLDTIEKTFRPYWAQYNRYITLQSRIDNLRQILNDRTANGSETFEPGKLLVVQTSILLELLARYQDYWKNWETFKILTETTQHPEYLLVVSNWEDYKFLELAEWLRKWQTLLELEDELDEVDSIQPVESVPTSEVINIEKAKETAETQHLTTSEQEERQTFVITGVIDPRTNEEISLDRAISLGIINQTNGQYVNPNTGHAMPIPLAMNAGKIKVELTTVKKSAEKRSDIGLITIKTYRELRPFTVKAVVDVNSDKQLSVADAQAAGILDQRRGLYVNKVTGDQLSLADALDSGLLIVEFDHSADKANSDGPQEVVTKTYAVRAVVDVNNKKRLTFREAVQTGLLDVENGSYFNNSTNEYIYVGDAIRKGFIKATVVNDVKSLDPSTIAPGGQVTVGDAALNNFRKKMTQPIAALSALKRAAYDKSANNGSAENGH